MDRTKPMKAEVYIRELETELEFTRAKLAKAVEELTRIGHLEKMTQLADCCFEKACRIHTGTGTCTFQVGVNRGYSEASEIASECLQSIKNPAPSRENGGAG